jgi:NADH-quinone oxidoreductase subunit J
MPNNISFLITATFSLAAALAAMRFRNPVHSALLAALAFAGLAVIYLQLGAEFIGFAQLLIYVGAISILALFAVLLTPGMDVQPGAAIASRSWRTGVTIAVATFVVIAGPILVSGISLQVPQGSPSVAVQSIGQELMTHYLLPLETIGLVLTAALLGAAVIAAPEVIRRTQPRQPAPRAQQKVEPVFPVTT